MFAGAQIGVVISMGLSGILVNSFGWQSVFYCYGVLGIVWYCCWLVLIYDEPSDHPFITKRELSYLQESVKGVTDHRQVYKKRKKKRFFLFRICLKCIEENYYYKAVEDYHYF